MNKEKTMDKQTTKPTVSSVAVKPLTLPNLPTEVTTSDWYTSTIHNTSLVNVGGEVWKMYLFECYNVKTKSFDVTLIKSKVDMLSSFGKRPPKSEGFGSNGEDYSESMKQTKQDIINLISKSTDSDGCFVGVSGKLYKIQNPFFREFVLINGKPKMRTTLKKGTKLDDGSVV
tara:strand:- start:245 stop:760 length:516 start_codon:yes stop_codon:yes gene_type:complete